MIEQADPRLISYFEWPCICGTWVDFYWWHRLWTGHQFERAVRVDENGRLIAASGKRGAVA